MSDTYAIAAVSRYYRTAHDAHPSVRRLVERGNFSMEQFRALLSECAPSEFLSWATVFRWPKTTVGDAITQIRLADPFVIPVGFAAAVYAPYKHISGIPLRNTLALMRRAEVEESCMMTAASDADRLTHETARDIFEMLCAVSQGMDIQRRQWHTPNEDAVIRLNLL